VLKLNAGQITFVKQWSFYFVDTAIAVLKSHKGSSYSLYKKLKPLQTEFDRKMKTVLTREQFDVWEKDRKKNGIIRQIVK